MRYQPTSVERAKARSKDLKTILGALGIDVPLTKAQLAISRAFGFADWAHMSTAVERRPDPGIEDDALLPHALQERRLQQAAAVSEALGIDQETALEAVMVVRPSGNPAIKVGLEEIASLRNGSRNVWVVGIAPSEISTSIRSLLDEAFVRMRLRSPETRSCLEDIRQYMDCYSIGTSERSYLLKLLVWMRSCISHPHLFTRPDGLGDEWLELLASDAGIVIVSGASSSGRHTAAFASLAVAPERGRLAVMAHDLLGDDFGRSALPAGAITFVGEPRSLKHWQRVSELARDNLVILVMHSGHGHQMQMIKDVAKIKGLEDLTEAVVGGIHTERQGDDGFQRSFWIHDSHRIRAGAFPPA